MITGKFKILKQLVARELLPYPKLSSVAFTTNFHFMEA